MTKKEWKQFHKINKKFIKDITKEEWQLYIELNKKILADCQAALRALECQS